MFKMYNTTFMSHYPVIYQIIYQIILSSYVSNPNIFSKFVKEIEYYRNFWGPLYHFPLPPPPCTMVSTTVYLVFNILMHILYDYCNM